MRTWCGDEGVWTTSDVPGTTTDDEALRDGRDVPTAMTEMLY